MIDLSGQVFGLLRVIKKDGFRSGAMQWVCECSCGTKGSYSSYSLRSGKTKSCGCLQRELLAKRNRSHGLSRIREYGIWKGMISRCENPRRAAYKDYGGRGICVCPQWRKSFKSFLADMGYAPSPAHTLDRVDPDGGYERGNCRWATRQEQSSNRHSCIVITHEGRSQTATEWAREMGLSPRTVQRRAKRGVTPPRLFDKGTVR